MRTRKKPGLLKPIKNRVTSLDELFEVLSDEQFEIVLSKLRLGSLKASAFIYWVSDPTISKYDSKKHELRSEDWKCFDLRLPGIHPNVGHVYLIDYESDQIHKNISLESSKVNRVLGLTGQRGGQKPKMPPRLFAFLTAWYAYAPFETDPEQLLSILEERHDLWGEAGVIDGRRGLDAIKEFLLALEEFEEAFELGDPGIDISIASGT